jgi:hypothetical protein
MKAMKYINRFKILALALLVTACGEDGALKKETFYIETENKGWLIDEEIGSHFIMIDNNKISQSYSMVNNTTDFTGGGSSVLFVRTRSVKREHVYQSYHSSFGPGFNLSLTAGYENMGDEISIRLGELSFHYNFKYKVITMVSTDFNTLSRALFDDGYDKSLKIASTIKFVDQMKVEESEYSHVMHFTLEDFEQGWKTFTPREIYLAKGIGLIGYKLHNGITYHRQ